MTFIKTFLETHPIFKEHLISGFQTFITTFGIVFFTTLQHGTILWTSSFWGAVLLTAGRAAVKEAYARIIPVSLGGRKPDPHEHYD